MKKCLYRESCTEFLRDIEIPCVIQGEAYSNVEDFAVPKILQILEKNSSGTPHRLVGHRCCPLTTDTATLLQEESTGGSKAHKPV